MGGIFNANSTYSDGYYYEGSYDDSELGTPAPSEVLKTDYHDAFISHDSTTEIQEQGAYFDLFGQRYTFGSYTHSEKVEDVEQGSQETNTKHYDSDGDLYLDVHTDKALEYSESTHVVREGNYTPWSSTESLTTNTSDKDLFWESSSNDANFDPDGNASPGDTESSSGGTEIKYKIQQPTNGVLTGSTSKWTELKQVSYDGSVYENNHYAWNDGNLSDGFDPDSSDEDPGGDAPTAQSTDTSESKGGGSDGGTLGYNSHLITNPRDYANIFSSAGQSDEEIFGFDENLNRVLKEQQGSVSYPLEYQAGDPTWGGVAYYGLRGVKDSVDITAGFIADTGTALYNDFWGTLGNAGASVIDAAGTALGKGYVYTAGMFDAAQRQRNWNELTGAIDDSLQVIEEFKRKHPHERALLLGQAAGFGLQSYATGRFALGRVRPGVIGPQTLSDVNLKGIIQGFGKTLRKEGEFFGWKPSTVTKSANDFTKKQLLDRGWTNERLEQVAKAYEDIARITPNNPSAAGRASQLRDILNKFF